MSALPPPAPVPEVSPKKSGFPAGAWALAIVAVLGAGACDKNSGAGTTTALSADTTIGFDDTAPDTDEPTTTLASPVTTIGSTGGIPAGITGTHDAPVPVGQIADIGGDWRLQVLDEIPDATAMMKASEYRYEPPPDGFTYMLVKVALGYFGTEDPTSGFLIDLNTFGTSNVALDNFCNAGFADNIYLDNAMFSGGVAVGYLCFVAPLAEAGTFQMYGNGEMGADEGVYLELVSPSSPVQPMAGLAGPQPGAASTDARLNAAPVGTVTAVGTDWQVTVTGAARDITSEVLAADDFNRPPPAGFHFVGVEVTILYNGAGSAWPADLAIGSVGSDNVQNAGDCGAMPGELDQYADLFTGRSASGTVCLVVPDDVDGLQLFASPNVDAEYVWFATS